MPRKIFDSARNIWTYTDGTFAFTEEQRLSKILFKDKWKMRHSEGNPDMETMLTEYKQLNQLKRGK